MRIESRQEHEFLAQMINHDILSSKEMNALILEWKETGDIGIRNKVVTYNMRLVIKVLHKIFSSGSGTIEEFVLPGMDGLLNALSHFDTENMTSFHVFAKSHVRGTILDYLRDETKQVRQPRRRGTKYSDNFTQACMFKEALGVAYEYQEKEDTTYLEVETIDLIQKLSGALEKLSEKEFRVIKMRYWEELTLDETGQKLGITYERVRQIQSSTLEKLSAELTKVTVQ